MNEQPLEQRPANLRPVKHHGFYWKWHGYQITSWVIWLISLWIFYICLTPAFDKTYMVIFNISIAVLYFVIAVLMIIATSIVPTDKIVFSSIKVRRSGESYEPKEDETYWMYCQAFSRVTSKHWGQWNRWVFNFDHHWKWLNNCIGDKNYPYFISLVVVFWITTLIIFWISISFIAWYHSNSSILNEENLYDYYSINKESEMYTISYWLVWILLLFCWLKLAFSSHLLGFQIYVKSQGMTTYQYVIKKREKKLI